MEIRPTKRFIKDYKKAAKHAEWQRENFTQFSDDLLAGHNPLPAHYREHALEDRKVAWAGYLSADLGPDLRVIFKRRTGIVTLHRIAGHAQIYKWQVQ